MNLGVQYFETRHEWRTFLTEVFDSATEVWFAFPLKGSGKTGVSYNDAVEEALCFGWIDSTVRALDAEYKIQRFTPRRRGSSYSQSNKERLKWLLEREMVHPSKVPEIEKILADPFVFPPDILARLQADWQVWANFERFSESYKRLRVAYIEQARVRPEEFEKRLRNLIAHSREGKKIPGYGGIEKYY